MNRRAFVTGLGAVLAAPFDAEAQPPAKGDLVVFFTLYARATDRVTLILDALKGGFRDLGYVEGRSLTLDGRFGEGRREVLAELAREIVGMQPRAIVTFGTPATEAARTATSTVPIVFISVGDPIGSGFGASLAHPGVNLTGFSFVGPELAAENLELLKQAFPLIASVAVLSPGCFVEATPEAQ